jgi:hypothetical protein
MSIPPIIPTSSGTSSANAYALPQKESLSSQTTINNDNTQRHTQSSAYEVNIQGGKQASYT